MASNVDQTDNDIDDEIQWLSPESVSNHFYGEDLCERAAIKRRNANKESTHESTLDDYNEGYIDLMLNKEVDHSADYEINSILQSIGGLDIDLDSVDSVESDDDLEALVITKPKNYIPNVFLPPKEDSESIGGHFRIDFDSTNDSCLVYTDLHIPKRYDSSQRAFGFYKSFLDRLKRLKCSDLRLELFLWPQIIKGYSICCISGPKSGKTAGYLIPLMNWFDSTESELRDESRVGAIVICGSTHQTYDIARQAKQWRDPEATASHRVRIISLNTTNESKQCTAILNGCDLLISTPGPLLRAIENKILDFSHTRCLIVDEADICLAAHRNTICQIYVKYMNQKKESNKGMETMKEKAMAIQTLIFAQKWTKNVKWFVKEVQHLPIVLFNSYYEASIAVGIKCNVNVIDSEDKREEAVIDIVETIYKEKRRIAIVCRSISEILFLRKKFSSIIQKNSIVVNHEKPHFELESLQNKWNHSNPLLFINDSAIRCVSGFKSSDCIIHYKLPDNAFADTFGDRFLLMRHYLKKVKNFPNVEKSKDLVNYVIVSPIDRDVVPELIPYLERLKTPVPSELISLCDYERRPLCPRFALFAKCLLISDCKERHYFNKYDQPMPEVPKSGQIKFVVTYVLGANDFYFRLNEFRGQSQTTGKWEKMEKTYGDIEEELNSYKDTNYNTIKKVSNREVYGIAVRGRVFRVRLMKRLREEELHFYEEYDPNDTSQVIELFCIDFGHKLRSYTRKLFELPPHLRDLPAFAFRGHLFGIKPVDNELEWDFRAKQNFFELVDNYQIHEISAWILKQIDGVFWINRLIVKKSLKNLNLRPESNPMQYLIDNKFVDKNDQKLPKVNTDYNRIVNIWHNHRLNKSAYNSYLIDDSTYVVVSDFVDLNHLYVVHESRIKRLKQLEDKWLSSLESLEVLKEVAEQQICFYKYTDPYYNEISLNRAKVISIRDQSVDLFLVDHGETVADVQMNCLLRIEDKKIKEFPFQAIKVSLFGVKEVNPITYDIICELTRNKEDQYLNAVAEKVGHENGIPVIRLFIANNESETEFTALSKLLVDLNYALYIDGEEDKDLKITFEQQIEDQNDDPEDYTSRVESEITDKFCQHFILKYLGIDENQDIDESTSDPKPNESRRERILRLLRETKNKKCIENENESESEEEEKVVLPFPECDPNDFNYETDPSAPIRFFDSDEEDIESDEDAIFEEEELT